MGCNGLSVRSWNQILVVHATPEPQESPTEMVLWGFASPEQKQVSPHDCRHNTGSSSNALQKPYSLNVVECRWMQVAGRSTCFGHRSANYQGQHANPRWMSLGHTAYFADRHSPLWPEKSFAAILLTSYFQVVV